jgi:hypothetical protein
LTCGSGLIGVLLGFRLHVREKRALAVGRADVLGRQIAVPAVGVLFTLGGRVGAAPIRVVPELLARRAPGAQQQASPDDK